MQEIYLFIVVTITIIVTKLVSFVRNFSHAN